MPKLIRKIATPDDTCYTVTISENLISIVTMPVFAALAQIPALF